MGHALDATVRMDVIQAKVKTPTVPAGGTASGMDPDCNAPTVYTDPLPSFSGEAVYFKEWERKAGATIKQTIYKGLLDAPATVGDAVGEARSKELFNMLLSCVADGHALNTIKKVRDDNKGLECGHLAWDALRIWYRDPTQVDSMISYWERKLLDISLNQDMSATEYINLFEMYVQ